MIDEEIRELERVVAERPSDEEAKDRLARARERAGVEDPVEAERHASIIDGLNCDAVDAKPRTIDWREEAGEDMEGWRSLDPTECDDCSLVVVTSPGQYGCGEARMAFHTSCDEPYDGEDGEEYECEKPDMHGDDHGAITEECEGYIYSDGPCMNFFYEIPRLEFGVGTAMKLVHTNNCLVELRDGSVGLALTAGGMDLSWEICQAHIALGYLPPAHFSDLPQMADRPRGEGDRLIVKACLKSVEVLANWQSGKRDRLERMLGGGAG